MDFDKSKIQMYLVGFDIQEMTPFADTVLIPAVPGPQQNKALEQVLDCTGVEVSDYSEDIAIIVDDQGMFKEGKPVFEIIAPDGTILHLAGTLLFSKNVYKEDSVDLGSLTHEEIQDLVKSLCIKITGMVKG